MSGQVDLDLAAVEQIVEPSQVRAIADAILKTRSYMDGKRTLAVSELHTWSRSSQGLTACFVLGGHHVFVCVLRT